MATHDSISLLTDSEIDAVTGGIKIKIVGVGGGNGGNGGKGGKGGSGGEGVGAIAGNTKGGNFLQANVAFGYGQGGNGASGGNGGSGGAGGNGNDGIDLF